jgi:hypothetical protein
VPLVGWLPLHAPEALHDVALLDDQLKAALFPLLTLEGFALKLTVGAGVAADTDTVTDWVADPPAPVQVAVYFVAALIAVVDCEPLGAIVPFQPPDATQEVALVEDHVNVEVPPLVTVVGLAVRVTVGAGVVTVTVVDCDALPPLPVQVSMYVALEVRLPVECEPVMASFPDQACEAMQLVAFADDHDSIAALPLTTVLGLALKVTVGAGELTVTVADCAAVPPVPVQLNV